MTLNQELKLRGSIRAKQDKVIAIADRLSLDCDTPISCMQHGAPCVNDLRKMIYPDFEPSLDSFLNHFNT